VGAIAWRFRYVPARSIEFSTMLALVLAFTVVIVPMTAPYNQVLLLPAVFLLLAAWNDSWPHTRIARLVAFVVAVTVLWPWLASLAFVLGAIFSPMTSLRRAWALPLYSSLGIPLAVLSLVMLYALELMRGSGPVGSVASTSAGMNC
jgi:hypothetical protein